MDHEPIKILYVEDDAYDIVILEETLRSSKAFEAAYSITHANDIAAGLEIVRERSFDVILLDLHLPGGGSEGAGIIALLPQLLPAFTIHNV